MPSKRKQRSDSPTSNRTPPRQPPNTHSQLDSETESSSGVIKVFPSWETRRRVAQIDPDNKCLIENMLSMQGVLYAHYLPKHLDSHEDMVWRHHMYTFASCVSKPHNQITCLEYLWGMQYRSLNLDSRLNVFRGMLNYK